MTLFSALTKRPLRSLALCFAVWKTILYLAILVSPGPGYDTSTLLLGAFQTPIDGSRTVQNRPELPASGIYKLIRWDALYFTDIARRGRPFEQEWAFGYGYTELLSRFTAGIPRVLDFHSEGFIDNIRAHHIWADELFTSRGSSGRASRLNLPLFIRGRVV